MSAIIKNSAKCNHCGVEIESKYRHDFNAHYCKKAPVPSEEHESWLFAVDGGSSYIRRCGNREDYTDTSVLE